MKSFAWRPLKNLDQPWGLLLVGVLLLVAVVVLLFLEPSRGGIGLDCQSREIDGPAFAVNQQQFLDR